MGVSELDYIYVGRIPGMRRWSPDYEAVAEWACGEENVSIMHKRAHEYVLDLTKAAPFECSINRRYDCGHLAYGPPRRLPSDCPECSDDMPPAGGGG